MDLGKTHDQNYVNDVLDGRRANGFGTSSLEVAESLKFTTASFVAGATEAYLSKSCVFSPTSGFHHAHFSHGGGFCTFNGLVAAAQHLLQIGAKKISIIDLDMHYGDGTETLIQRHRLEDKVKQYTFGGGRITLSNSEDWIKQLPTILDQHKDADIWLVQLGADPFINDPLGGVLTMDQLYRRDKIVFQKAKEFGIPVCWNLAGGYTNPFEDVLKIHMNSVKAYVETHKE